MFDVDSDNLQMQLEFEMQVNQSLRNKLQLSNKENAKLCHEQASIEKEIVSCQEINTTLDLECKKQVNQHQNIAEQNLQLEQEIQQKKLENEKLLNHKKKIGADAKKANKLFRQTLEIKQQYEELILRLHGHAEIKDIVQQAISELQAKKTQEDKGRDQSRSKAQKLATSSRGFNSTKVI